MLMLFKGDLAAHETFRFIEEKLRIGIWSCDLVTGHVEWSWGCYRLFGLEPNSVSPSYDEHQSRLHPDDRRSKEEMALSLAQGVPTARDVRLILPNRTLRWIHERLESLHDPTGIPTTIAGLMLDVTNHYKTIQPLKVDKDRFDALLKVGTAAKTVIWTVRADSNRGLKLHSWKKTREGRPHLIFEERGIDIVHAEDRADTLRCWSAAFETGQTFSVEHRVLQPDGEYRWVGSWAVPVFNQDRETQEWIGFSVDVHEKKLSSLSTPAASRLTGAQMRAARGMLNWSVKKLAARTGISPAVIRRLEEYDGAPLGADDLMDMIRKTFSNAGIQFLFPQSGKPGLQPR
jgi:PAS domain-containing protein